MTGPDVLNEVITFPGVSSRPSKAQREVGAHPISPTAGGHGLARHRARPRCGVGAAHQRDVCSRQRQQPGPTHPRAGVAAGLADRPAGPDLAATLDGQRRRCRRRGVAKPADRLAASAWSRVTMAARRAVGSTGRGDLRRSRPPLAELPGGRRRRQGLPDPQPGPHPRPARVRASSSVVRRRSPGVRLRRRPHAAAQRRNPRRQGRHPGRRHRRRRVGTDGPRSRILHLPDTRSQGLLPDAARTRCLQRRRAATTASIPHRRSAHPGGTRRPLPAAVSPGPRPARGLPGANANPRWTTPV